MKCIKSEIAKLICAASLLQVYRLSGCTTGDFSNRAANHGDEKLCTVSEKFNEIWIDIGYTDVKKVVRVEKLLKGHGVEYRIDGSTILKVYVQTQQASKSKQLLEAERLLLKYE